MWKLPKLSQKGLSLVEVIIAVFLVGAIVLVIANVPNVIRLVSGTQIEGRAREVAARAIEDARLSGYDNLANGTVAISDPKLTAANSMAASRTITDCPAGLCNHNEQIKKVSVAVTWTENKEPKNFTVVTLVSKGGLR